jgi:hypothetical protein
MSSYSNRRILRVTARGAGVLRLVSAEESAHRLRQQTDSGHRESDMTSGLVACLGDEPVGWCAVSREPPMRG